MQYYADDQHAQFALAVLLTTAILLICGFSNNAWGAVSLSVTRAIITEKSKETSIRIENEGEYPVLIQAWIDNGDTKENPEYIQVPFIITNPQFRLDAQTSQLLRVLLVPSDNVLFSDQESVFWLNIQEVPSQIIQDKESNSYIQIAFRTRIKLFYRPQGLTQDIEKLHSQLRFTLAYQAGQYALQVHNPTSFHFTLLTIQLGVDSQKPVLSSTPEDGMIAPQQTVSFPLETQINPIDADLLVRYFFLNDFGQLVEGRQQLSATP